MTKSTILSLPPRKRLALLNSYKKHHRPSLSQWTEQNIYLKDGLLDFSKHLYLKEPYNDTHPYQVKEKASQMGASVEELVKVIHACGKKGMKVIYFFPTDGDVIDFSKDRFSEIQSNSPSVDKMIIPVKDSIKMKQFTSGGILYFRGLFYAGAAAGKSGSKVKSIDADFLVFDELDEASPIQKEAARHRIDHSKWKWIHELSTPTIPDYGIDVEWQRSDMRYWNIKCPHCNTWNVLEHNFPQCLKRIDEENVIRACSHCRKDISSSLLDPAACKWVAERPTIKKRRGYHYSQLFSLYIDPHEILTEYEDPRTDLTLFHNHRLGLPYIDAQNRIQPEEVLACCRDYSFTGTANRCFMGVDVGKREMYVYITTKASNGKKKTVHMETVKVSVNPDREAFAELIPLMQRFDVTRCVIDAQPETHSARKFARQFKRRVYLCHYVDAQKDDAVWTENDEDGVGRVNVGKTESLDATFREIKAQELLLPYRSPIIEQFAKHCYNLVRVAEIKEQTGEVKHKYIRVNDDHLTHARNYCRIAESKDDFHYGTVAAVVGKRTFA